MKRKSVICSLLLLPLWLMAAGGDFVNLPGVGPVVGNSYHSQNALFAAAGHSNSGSNDDLLPFKHFLQHIVRRLTACGGTDDKLASSDADAVGSPAGLKPDITGFAVVSSPADLIHGWQFSLRAASQPRAPSSFPSVS